ncbi:hypothetical protein GCM10007907_25350 [Chitinimonas prasina]|uniref:DUF2314 domain-containing protein n=2 Tax=Chitinimonas prasina TaxID=1434937 RepID=A0ABQ5YFH6_9NEIS|nr:hypothetical protein GCM10007907_25350 [Chitinimonas prasina]
MPDPGGIFNERIRENEMKSALFAAVCVLAAGFCLAGDEKIGDQVVYVNDQDKAMNAAIAKAQATLDTFLQVAESKPSGTLGYKLKVRFEDENGAEHIWVTPFKREKTGFVGVVANDPEVVESVEAGKSYSFSRAQISDWGYVKDGKQVGSYTVCVIFKSMPADQVKRYKDDYGFECND